VISRRFSVWQKLVALAPLLLVAVYLPGEIMLRCRMDGVLRPACCCPPDATAQNSGPVVKAQDCCDRELTGAARPVVTAARVSQTDVAGAVVVAAAAALPLHSSAVDFAQPRGPDWVWQAHGPPRQGPPLVLLKHAFLI
jgi:hypothetical protein